MYGPAALSRRTSESDERESCINVSGLCSGALSSGPTTPTAIVELARLALKAKSETARIAAIRELLDRGYGRSRQAMEITAPAGDPLQQLFEELRCAVKEDRSL
jgi:hypothetical protein